MQNGWGHCGSLVTCRWGEPGTVKMVKMIDQNSTKETNVKPRKPLLEASSLGTVYKTAGDVRRWSLIWEIRT